MSLVKWNPLKEMEDMFDRYNKGIDWPGFGRQELIKTGDWSPRVDIAEAEKEFVIKAEIPEVDKKDVNITVNQGVLSIQGERKEEKKEKGKKFNRIERSYGSFTRNFTLPDNVDETKIKATFKDGMLTLLIPKTSKAKPKGIEVKVE